MPRFDNLCSECSHRFESIQPMAEDALVDCPACGRPSLSRVLYPPTVFDGTPKTIGTLAERNNTTLGRYKLDSVRQAQLERKELGRQQLRESLPDGMSMPERVTEKPWYVGDSKASDLASLSPQQKTNYLMTGDSRG